MMILTSSTKSKTSARTTSPDDDLKVRNEAGEVGDVDEIDEVGEVDEVNEVA